MLSYLYIAGTIFFTVYGQIILKWRINKIGLMLQTDNILQIIFSYMKFLFDPFIFSGFFSAFIASIFWMFAMTKFEITQAYPFMSLAPALVFIFGIFLLGETFTIGKIIGLIFIIIGILITVRF